MINYLKSAAHIFVILKILLKILIVSGKIVNEILLIAISSMLKSLLFFLLIMITVIGAGRVGSAAAFDILRYKISDVILIDTDENRAKGEALDMMQAAPAIEFDGTIRGTSDFREMQGSELVIVTAGIARKPNMTRIDLMNINAKIVRSVVREVAKYAPKAILMMVTNPVDVMTYISLKETGFSRNQLFGMGNILDTMRFRTYIANEMGVSREDARALVMGEHGDSMVPLVEYASVSGIPIRSLLSEQQIEKIVNQTVTSGADVIKLKGSTDIAPGTVIAVTADAILTGRNRVMSVSTCLDGEYGQSCVSIGVPVILGNRGVEKIIELDLSEQTRERFMNSITAVKNAIAELKA